MPRQASTFKGQHRRGKLSQDKAKGRVEKAETCSWVMKRGPPTMGTMEACLP